MEGALYSSVRYGGSTVELSEIWREHCTAQWDMEGALYSSVRYGGSTV